MSQMSMIRRLTSLAVGLSLLVPVGSSAASTSLVISTNEAQTSQDASRESALRTLNQSEEMNEEYDPSTNCYGNAVPFITGTVRDALNNPVEGARVNVTMLGMTFPNPSTNGPFQMWETKADGTYSICTWEGQSIQQIVEEDKNLSNALLAIATPPEISAGTSQGSQITLMASFISQNPQGQLVRNTVNNASRSNECLDPTVNATKACRMDFVLGTPIVTAKVKQSDSTAIPNAKTTLEFFYRPSPSPNRTEDERNLLGKWVQLGVIPSNSTGDVGINGFSSSNKFRLKVQGPECYIEDGQTCPFDGLGSQSDNFSVTVTDPANFASTGSAAWDSNSQSARDFTLVPANLRAQIIDGVGNNVEGIVDLNLSNGATSVTESTQYGGRFALTLSDGTWSVEVVAPSYGAIGTNATYSVSIAGGSVTAISRTTAPTGPVCSDATACLDNVKLQLTPPNFLFSLKDTDGKVVEGADLSLDEYSPLLSGYPWTNKGYQQSGTAAYGQIAGVGGFTLSNGKVYKISIGPPYRGSTDLVRTEYFLKVSDDGSAIRRCAIWNGDPTKIPCEFGWIGNLTDEVNRLVSSDGKYPLAMSVANFRGFVCAPGEGSACTVVPYADVDVSRWQESFCQGCTGYYQGGIGMYAWSGQSGTIALSFTTEGRYRMQVRPPRNRPEVTDSTLYASNNVEFYADQIGSEWKFFTLDANGAATSTELPTATVESLTRVALRLKTPSFVGVVRAPSGAANTYSWVDIRKETPTVNCSNCSEWLGGANTDSNGVFALSLEVGKHVMTANPSVSLLSEGLTRTEFKFSALDCDSNGAVEIYTYSSGDCANKTLIPAVEGKIVITLQGANFSGVLKRPDNDQVVPSAGIDVEKWVVCAENIPCPSNGSGYWTWAGINSFTNQSGRFAFRLNEIGSYRVTFRSPNSLQSQFSSSRIEVQVAGESLAVSATADASVFSYNAASNEYSVKLKLPNVSGTVTLPFDGADVDTANDPAANTWINVEKWGTDYCFDGCYQWTPDVSGANTNSNGDYGMTLPAGRWRLTFNPPWAVSGAAKGTREIVVTSSAVCLFANSGNDGTTCSGATIAAGDLDVELPSPNFSGTVKNPDSSVSQWSPIQFQKWDSTFNWWQGTNIWANTDNNGKFGVNLIDNGSYRVTFEPSWQAVGLSGSTIYIRVCSDGAVVELIDTEVAAKSGITCTSSDTLGNPATVYTLVGANMQGVVKDGSNGSATLGDAWIAVLNCGNGGTNDWCMWERGVNSKGFGVDKGKFALNLTHTSGGLATKYRIEVNPPWNTTAGLVRGQYDVWVKDFDGSSPGDEWCLAADFTAGNSTCSNARKSSSAEWQVTLSAGNLAGKLLSPDGATGIAYGWMQVEKWTQQPWNTSSYYWQWTNYWVNTNQTGSFGLNIPGSDSGLFRLTANPGWDNPNGFARRRMFIRVASDGLWCEQIVNPSLVNDATPYGSDGDGAECTEGDDNVADSVTGLTVKLSNSNLSGTLYTSSTDLGNTDSLGTSSNKVRDAWMSLQVKRTGDSNGSDPGGEWTYWEWLGGSNTSGSNASRGKFGFVIEENGDYRIDVQPSWRDTSGLDGQFYIQLAATSCGDDDGCSIALVGTPDNVLALGGGTYAVKYPPPNFKGIVKDKTNTNAIAGSWISIYKSNWEWVTGISTGWNGVNAGKFGTKLDDGTYRVEVWPRWDDASSGMRRVISLVVAGGVVTSCTPTPGCDLSNPSEETDKSRTLTLRGENLSGKVYFPGTTDADDITAGNQTPMPWAGVEVRTCGDEAGTQCDWGDPGVTWVDGQSSNETGLLRLGLDSRLDPTTNNPLPYMVTVWPNWSYFSASPLRLLVRVGSDGVASWKYETESNGYDGVGTAFNPDFGRIPPNLSVTVTGVDSQRFVKLYQCVGGTVNGDCDDGSWSEVITIGTVKVASTWKASFTVTTAADYKVVALRTVEDAVTGSLPDATSTFSHNGSTLQSKTVAVRP